MIAIFHIRGFGRKETDSLSKCGSFVFLSGKALGLEGSDLVLPPLCPCPWWEGEVDVLVRNQSGQLFYTWFL